MKTKLFLTGALAATLAITSCDIKKKGDLELPEVDVDVTTEEGNIPEYEVDWMDVDVRTTTKMVEVPKVVIVMEEEEVEVPIIDFDMPGEDKMERTLLVETEVYEKGADLEIKQIRADNNRLYVIAELEENDDKLDGKKMRISDQVELNAPDLDVKYIIVGNRPNRKFNNANTYVKSMNDLDDRVKNAKVIYED
ncbi:MAG: hypothetical protein ACSHW7_08225 [Patiriisocius sp.]|uniref:hypothetical protein n=1 Tax=Patiriisocius sp. TaxID=2822396 RepID=UPI003EF9C898